MTEEQFAVSPCCVECAFGDGVAILDTASNKYFSLNSVGQFIWKQLSSPVTTTDIIARVSSEYGVQPSQCADDVRKLLDDLAAHKLIRS